LALGVTVGVTVAVGRIAVGVGVEGGRVEVGVRVKVGVGIDAVGEILGFKTNVADVRVGVSTVLFSLTTCTSCNDIEVESLDVLEITSTPKLTKSALTVTGVFPGPTAYIMVKRPV
jgi:hypothetical protein